jgi:hypothetical protein
MEDVDKLDNIQDCFIHYQLIRFCQATRLQYLNGQVQLANQQVPQQQHVDHKIAKALLKKATRETYKTWTQQDSVWVDMRLHESHDEGGFGVPNNTISRHAAVYATNARFVAFLGTFARPAQEVWLPGNDLQDPATWSPLPLCTFKHLHSELLLAAQRKINGYRQQYADNQNISFLPAIMTTSSRMHCEFLRLLFLQAHRETTAHFNATGLPPQQNRSDNAFAEAG